MDEKKYDIWLEKFKREIGIKSSVVVFGNTADIMLNQDNKLKYDTVVNTLISAVKAKGFDHVVKWDRVDGIDYNVSKDINTISNCTKTNSSEEDYDLGDDDYDILNNGGQQCYKEPDEFFPYMLNILKSGNNKYAFILDYSDYIFGNANSLSEKERNYLAILGKALENGKSYDMLSNYDNNGNIGNIIIIIAKNSAMIPPAYYLNNPMVSTVNVPLPGRNEREKFVETNQACLNVSQNLAGDKSLMADFIDALDGLSIKDIAQIMRLSRQTGQETLSFEKLINLYKYGEKTSPWEELSKDKIENIESRLSKRVKGQSTAIDKVKNVIIRACTGFSGLQHSSKQKKPKGTLFFVGPTGVGKTELAKALAEFIFGDENACIRFDMSEYNHEHSDQRLVGAPPGYVGYEAGGQLTNAVKEKPFCVLLFDEIEKAHGRILDKFLQILEDGRLTDGKGETVYFSEAVIIFTSNIGADKVAEEIPENATQKEIEQYFISKVQKHFINKLHRPELLNRIGDNIVAFNFIDNPDVFTSIAKSKFKAVEDFVAERYKAKIEFENEDEAFLAIAKATDKKNGGRGILNVMESVIVNPLSEFIFENFEMLAGRTIITILSDSGRKGYPEFDFDFKY